MNLCNLMFPTSFKKLCAVIIIYVVWNLTQVKIWYSNHIFISHSTAYHSEILDFTVNAFKFPLVLRWWRAELCQQEDSQSVSYWHQLTLKLTQEIVKKVMFEISGCRINWDGSIFREQNPAAAMDMLSLVWMYPFGIPIFPCTASQPTKYDE